MHYYNKIVMIFLMAFGMLLVRERNMQAPRILLEILLLNEKDI